jgi:putative transposase
MNTYKRHRFPSDIISYAVWLYHRFNLRRVVTVTAGVPDHKINGKQHYLWRTVDQDGEVVDVFLQAKRDGAAVTTRQLNASSKGYCAVMVVNPERL